MRLEMSLAQDKTAELWKKFMPRRGEIKNRRNAEYISMRIYGENREQQFLPTTLFEKWAAVEVLDHNIVPEGMESYCQTGGTYAVFIHEGPAMSFPKTMQHIFGTWLPESEYEQSGREHFEVLPEEYNPVDPEAKEEVWIPIK